MSSAGLLANPLVRAAPPKPMLGLPISPLQLDQMTRDQWGLYDPLAIARLSPLAQEKCYQHKFYKTPLVSQEVVPANGFITQNLQITRGSLIFGVYLPALIASISSPPLNQPPSWTIQITDKSGAQDYELFDQPIPSYFLANLRVTYQSALAFPAVGQVGSAPNFFADPYPVTGNGLFLVQIWETSGAQQRIECVLGVLEMVE